MLQVAMTAIQPLLALEGEWADFRAVIVVLISFVMLIGTIYMLLWSNFGSKIGYLVLMVSLFGWMIIMSVVWLAGVPGTLPGTGPRVHEPHWIPFTAESEQGQEFTRVLGTFPSGQGWDEPGEVYAGNIDSRGELETVTLAVQEALARRAAAQGTQGDEPGDWAWRLRGVEPATDEERARPVATVGFYQQDTPLLFGVSIPATEDHPAVTVFALRDKGATFLYSLLFLIASIVGFALHLWLLARTERPDQGEPEAQAEPAREPATV